jgi:quercetin dioxygenase-like cupin family protein
MSEARSFRLAEQPVHLGRGAVAVPQERFTGDAAWYERYVARTSGDGIEGRLVSMFTFSEPWDSWEVHPDGEELVVCVDGALTLYQEIDGEVRKVNLAAGEAVVNPSGAWHTADISGSATALFITAGAGTENRPRT